MSEIKDEVAGLPARRAALRLLDNVMRMGTPMDQATNAACKGLDSPDRALAIAIAQEALRWVVDLDELIDEKTQQNLPEDAGRRPETVDARRIGCNFTQRSRVARRAKPA
jgi:16S rRNA (cytosine967-C5)-methyltransferase